MATIVCKLGVVIYNGGYMCCEASTGYFVNVQIIRRFQDPLDRLKTRSNTDACVYTRSFRKGIERSKHLSNGPLLHIAL